MSESKRIDLTGQVFNNWEVISFSHTSHKASYWNCRCKCGEVRPVNGNSLKRSLSKSCGSCGSKGAGNYKNKLYGSWSSMMTRVYNKNHMHYENYGGRGIEVCERWKNFENFLLDMGYKPEGTTLDRINSDGNYEPSNCRWSTPLEQSNNQRSNKKVIYKGNEYNVSQLSRHLKINYTTLKRRVDFGRELDAKVK